MNSSKDKYFEESVEEISKAFKISGYCFPIFSVVRKGVGGFYWMVFIQGLVNACTWFLRVLGLKSG